MPKTDPYSISPELRKIFWPWLTSLPVKSVCRRVDDPLGHGRMGHVRAVGEQPEDEEADDHDEDDGLEPGLRDQELAPTGWNVQVVPSELEYGRDALRLRRPAPSIRRSLRTAPGNSIVCGATSGLPTCSWICVCAPSGMSAGSPVQACLFTIAVTSPSAGPTSIFESGWPHTLKKSPSVNDRYSDDSTWIRPSA